jgi:hypothetical protein
MELRDFVSESLRQIIDGVEAAQNHIRGKGAYINPPRTPGLANSNTLAELPGDQYREVHLADFDVAVSVSEASEIEGTGSARIYVAKAAGAMKKGHEIESSARIKFPVPVVYTTQNEAEGRLP